LSEATAVVPAPVKSPAPLETAPAAYYIPFPTPDTALYPREAAEEVTLPTAFPTA